MQWAIAKIEHRGLPIDLPLLTRLRRHWDGMRTDMVTELDPFGIYEIAGGVAHWRNERFEVFVSNYKLPWPRLANEETAIAMIVDKDSRKKAAATNAIDREPIFGFMTRPPEKLLELFNSGAATAFQSIVRSAECAPAPKSASPLSRRRNWQLD